jgi:hypothetical protein
MIAEYDEHDGFQLVPQLDAIYVLSSRFLFASMLNGASLAAVSLCLVVALSYRWSVYAIMILASLKSQVLHIAWLPKCRQIVPMIIFPRASYHVYND